MHPLILGSSSPFRAELLRKLNLPFKTASPNIDETAHQGEKATSLVKRLAEQKAIAIAFNHPNALIIGSDQVAVLHGEILGKPANHKAAIAQLRAASGQTVLFLTGLALFNSETQRMQSLVDPFEVTFKNLSDEQIQFYLETDEPYQCAGSFKSEGFGITLFEKLHGNDPNSLIGLPLIELISLLNNEGLDLLQPNPSS
jgi:MAF protein